MAELGRRPKPRNKSVKEANLSPQKVGIPPGGKGTGKKVSKSGMTVIDKGFVASHAEHASSSSAESEILLAENDSLTECRDAWLNLASEDTLRKLWDTPEEDEAWRDLLKEM